MRAQITNTVERGLDYQIWKDPTTNILMATTGEPKYSFKDVNAFPLYDLNAHFATQQKIAKGNADKDSMFGAFLNSELEETTKQYQSDVLSGGAQKFAALRSNRNSAVNIVNVWTEVQGRRDRKFVAKNMAREIATPNLLISLDKITKFSGMTKLDEGQLGMLKELSYSRQNFTAAKYGLKFIISEESRLKNVHNVLQDSIAVATTKIDQRASFDVVSALGSLTTQSAIGAWDIFDSNTDHSTYAPQDDIGIAQLAIEGSGVGGKLTRIGMHQLTYAKYTRNTNLRGVANTTPAEYNFEPGTKPMLGIPDVGLVLDQSFRQGYVYAVDNSTEDAAVAYFQGPQRIGSAHDEETGDDKYFIIDYHLASLVQSETGRIITGVTTPIVW